MEFKRVLFRPTLGDRVPKQVKIEVSHKKNLQMRGTAVMRPRPTQPFDTPPLSDLAASPPRPRLRRLALMVREAQQLDVARIEISATIAPLDDMVADHPIARAAAFAPCTTLALDPGDQRPPLAGQVESGQASWRERVWQSG